MVLGVASPCAGMPIWMVFQLARRWGVAGAIESALAGGFWSLEKMKPKPKWTKTLEKEWCALLLRSVRGQITKRQLARYRRLSEQRERHTPSFRICIDPKSCEIPKDYRKKIPKLIKTESVVDELTGLRFIYFHWGDGSVTVQLQGPVSAGNGSRLLLSGK